MKAQSSSHQSMRFRKALADRGHPVRYFCLRFSIYSWVRAKSGASAPAVSNAKDLDDKGLWSLLADFTADHQLKFSWSMFRHDRPVLLVGAACYRKTDRNRASSGDSKEAANLIRQKLAGCQCFSECELSCFPVRVAHPRDFKHSMGDTALGVRKPDGPQKTGGLCNRLDMQLTERGFYGERAEHGSCASDNYLDASLLGSSNRPLTLMPFVKLSREFIGGLFSELYRIVSIKYCDGVSFSIPDEPTCDATSHFETHRARNADAGSSFRGDLMNSFQGRFLDPLQNGVGCCFPFSRNSRDASCLKSLVKGEYRSNCISFSDLDSARGIWGQKLRRQCVDEAPSYFERTGGRVQQDRSAVTGLNAAYLVTHFAPLTRSLDSKLSSLLHGPTR